MQSEPAVSSSRLIHNGVLSDAGDPCLAITDRAIVRGQGAFETLAVYGGRPFMTQAHLDRLRRAAVTLELNCPPEPDLIEAMDVLLRANGLQETPRARLRITLTSPADGAGWVVEASPAPFHPAMTRVITIPFVRNERGALSGLKTINYGENVVATRLAREAGADEALFGNTRDELCEGTWSNVFVYRDGRYLTPPLSSGCLPGVTRALVLDLLGHLGLPVLETAIPLGDLNDVEGAFLTSSIREIQRISSIDGRELAEPPCFAALKEAFAEFVATSYSSGGKICVNSSPAARLPQN